MTPVTHPSPAFLEHGTPRRKWILVLLLPLALVACGGDGATGGVSDTTTTVAENTTTQAPTTTTSTTPPTTVQGEECIEAYTEMTVALDEATLLAEVGDVEGIQASNESWNDLGYQMGISCEVGQVLDHRMSLLMDHLYGVYNGTNGEGQSFIAGVAGVFCDDEANPWTLTSEARDGCVSMTDTHVKTETTTTTEYELTDSDRATIYLAVLENWTADKPVNLIDTASNADLIELGHLVCDAFDDGATSEEISLATVMSLAESDTMTDVNVQAAGTIIGAGVAAFCPEHEGRVG